MQVGGEPITLTLKEFDLLHTLLQNQGHVLSRSQLLEDVWGMTYVGETRTVDVHVQTLRQKLAAAQEGADASFVRCAAWATASNPPRERAHEPDAFQG